MTYRKAMIESSHFPFHSLRQQRARRWALWWPWVSVYVSALLLCCVALCVAASDVPSLLLGLTMAQFPIAPRYAKMLCIANQNGCLPYMIAIASALSVNVSQHISLWTCVVFMALRKFSSYDQLTHFEGRRCKRMREAHRSSNCWNWQPSREHGQER